MDMNTTISVEPFKRLVKLAARAFYDDVSTKGENQSKNNARGDNKGIAVVVLDALTRRLWVNEEGLAKDLKIHIKQLRRILRLFEEDKLLTRAHRKETAKVTKKPNAGGADGQRKFGSREDDKNKLHTHSYCCLDYAQIYDVVRYRLHRMRKMIKDELENNNAVQQYICPSCGRRYNALDALRLISLVDEYFHCENCDGVLVAESDKLAAQEGGDGDDNARKRRREKLKDMLQNMEVQLKPLMDQLSRVKDLPIPEIGSLQAWQLHENAAGRATNGDPNSDDHFKYSQGQGYGGTPMPFLGETKVEVAFAGDESKENIKSETGKCRSKSITTMDDQAGNEPYKRSNVERSSRRVRRSMLKLIMLLCLNNKDRQEESAKQQQELSQTSMSNGLSESSSNRSSGHEIQT
ncbi:transcription initiation factor IIE subunit alpha [Populus alba x Populus x berolinensis]|nr:transcription initiation factor IIE subunit alpha [Populus alba x Populus x berolinensis]